MVLGPELGLKLVFYGLDADSRLRRTYAIWAEVCDQVPKLPRLGFKMEDTKGPVEKQCVSV